MRRKPRVLCVACGIAGLQICCVSEILAADTAPSSFDAGKYGARPSSPAQPQPAPAAAPAPVAAEEMYATRTPDQSGPQPEPLPALEAPASAGDRDRNPRQLACASDPSLAQAEDCRPKN